MTDPNDFLDPEAEPEPEPEPVREPFISMNTLLRNLPYMAALALAIFGVAYSNFSAHAINGYREFSSQRYKSQQFLFETRIHPIHFSTGRIEPAPSETR